MKVRWKHSNKVYKGKTAHSIFKQMLNDGVFTPSNITVRELVFTLKQRAFSLGVYIAGRNAEQILKSLINKGMIRRLDNEERD